MNSHMFFTVHIYQYRVEKNSKNAGGGKKIYDARSCKFCYLNDLHESFDFLQYRHFISFTQFYVSLEPMFCLLLPVHGGRSRLHLIDLASCEGYTGSKKDGGASSMSLSGLGNVIISLINGAKHVPHRCVSLK